MHLFSNLLSSKMWFCRTECHFFTGICQRDTSQSYGCIGSDKTRICSDIVSFWRENIENRFPLSCCKLVVLVKNFCAFFCLSIDWNIDYITELYINHMGISSNFMIQMFFCYRYFWCISSSKRPCDPCWFQPFWGDNRWSSLYLVWIEAERGH